MEPSGLEMAKVIEEYGELMEPTGLSHLGAMAKKAFLRPGSVWTSACRLSALKALPMSFMNGMP